MKTAMSYHKKTFNETAVAIRKARRLANGWRKQAKLANGYRRRGRQRTLSPGRLANFMSKTL
ncbi:hypothetical protein [Desulfovibrio sp. ZJ200]|uniref:hypothetical protein n=1 Tax=Desulfovibrio sp. ZJ200 TaxID=2709792 RepID=UPI0013EA55C5|nr:hypothetical protein [Desulfovibrio sp. ZJ200]